MTTFETFIYGSFILLGIAAAAGVVGIIWRGVFAPWCG